MGLAEAGENLLPWLERWRGMTPQILMGVRWYVAYPLSTHHVEELMQEREVSVDPATIKWLLLGGHNVLEQRHLSDSFGLRDRSALRCLAALVL